MYYYFIIAFQAFCIYHLFKHKNSFYWIFAIIFLPLVGCIVYLVTQVFTKRDSEKIQDNLTTIIDPSKKLRDLERKLEFTDTYENRVNLADAYLASHAETKAIEHYKIALEDKTQNGFYVKTQMAKAYYNTKNFDQVIALGEILKDHKEFNKSDVPFYYGMALAEKGRTIEAEAQLETMDRPYSNYNERLAFAKFLLSIDKSNDAKALLDELHEEMQNMTKMNLRIYKTTILEVEKLRAKV
ncbi:hypothetical protein [Gelidibacter salicanalis]|uniref:Cardiolipin synthase N-terminal domain-containing protein n=1 Tax=Gelidibacter salicanalis TaxID=291193 RepID=A0A934NIP3_9FLAO|nr:hypothetical protein [Gelidibacter salicanalis]MBJ7882376.1 hypothetical protein [Gelidibacter salicanalis]